jgi:hypothetical protein
MMTGRGRLVVQRSEARFVVSPTGRDCRATNRKNVVLVGLGIVRMFVESQTVGVFVMMVQLLRLPWAN